MAQGGGKLGKATKSAGSQKRKAVAKKKVGKGPKRYAAKGRKRQDQETETTNAINRKNESMLAAKAVGAGNTFFLREIKEAGKKELGKQMRQRNKKEANAKKLTDRLKQQLQELDR